MEKSGNQKNIPIKANYTIKCEKGYGCKEPNIHPAFVTVTGDSTVLRKIDTIYTQSLELNRVNQKVEQELLLLKPSDAVFMSSDKVQLEVAVEKLLERTISVPIQVINPPINAKQIHLFPSRVKIKFSALQHDFAAFDTAGFKASVNASATRTGKSGIFLSMQPGNTFVLSIEPKETEILLIKK
jgi:YbbR domain-containing protein